MDLNNLPSFFPQNSQSQGLEQINEVSQQHPCLFERLISSYEPYGQDSHHQFLLKLEEENNEEPNCPLSNNLSEPTKQEENNQQPLQKVEKPKALNEGCHCSKSQCNKHYCSCFKNNRHCGTSCGCRSCMNSHKKMLMLATIEPFWSISREDTLKLQKMRTRK